MSMDVGQTHLKAIQGAKNVMTNHAVIESQIGSKGYDCQYMKYQQDRRQPESEPRKIMIKNQCRLIISIISISFIFISYKVSRISFHSYVRV